MTLSPKGPAAWLAALTLTLIDLTGTSAPALAGDDDRQARLDDAFEAKVDAGFTGFAAIAIDGEIVFARGAGDADPTTGRPFDLDTQVDIASITKSMTGMIAADLIASGRLDAQATLADFFDDTPPSMAAITVHQLLTHASGLPDVVGSDYEIVDFDTTRARAFAETLRSEPGSAYYYSNLGYSFLAAIIEAVTGESYETVLMAYLARAGAVSTGYDRALDRDRSVILSDGRTVAEASWGGHPPNWTLMGNGGVVSTVRDLLAWRQAYAGGRIVSPAARDLAQQPYQREGADASSFYGYGLVVEDDARLGRFYWHNGGSRNFNAHWRDYSDRGVTIIVVSNQWNVTADSMVAALTRALFPDAFSK